MTPMTAQLQFRNLTLGYDRHPAVHHLDGAVEAGSLTAVVGPNGAGKSTLFKGVVGVIKPLAGRIERDGAVAAGHRLSAADRRDRPQLPDQRLRHGGDGAVAQQRPVRRHRRARTATPIERAIAAVGLTGFEQRADRHAVRRADAAHAVRAAAAAGRARDRARRAVQRHRRQDLAPICIALVRRWHGEKRTVLAALHDLDLVKANFPRGAAARARAGGLGRDRRRADAGQHRQGAAHVRGVRRARRGLRGARRDRR